MSPKAKPPDKEIIRRVEKARPGAKATDPSFDAIIDAILDANPKSFKGDRATWRQSKKDA